MSLDSTPEPYAEMEPERSCSDFASAKGNRERRCKRARCSKMAGAHIAYESGTAHLKASGSKAISE